MPWWGWIAIGAMLLGAELFLVDLEFYLVFLGVAALAVGGVTSAAPDLAPWAQWLCFAAIAPVSIVLFRARLYRRFRGDAPGLADPLVGETTRLPRALPSGGTDRAELRGSTWTLRNEGSHAIAAGTPVRVTAVRGIELSVAAIEEEPPT